MKEELKEKKTPKKVAQPKKKEEKNNQLEQLVNEKKELEEKVKYLQADLINYRKRKDEELIERLKYANQDLILEILPAIDNFELALRNNNVSEEIKNYLVGFQMIYSNLLETLKSFGIETIERKGEVFDPRLEQVLVTEEDKNYPEDTVLEVLQKGYKLKDRVIRPATIKINKLKGENVNE